MNKKLVMILLLPLLLMTLSSCWSRKELNELAIVAAMGIDKNDTGYQLTTQVIIPNEVSGQTATIGVPISAYDAESITICEAFRKLTSTLPRRPYLSHVNIVVISEEVAKEGIAGIIDSLVRDDDFRMSSSVFIAKGNKATEILKVLTSLESIPANKIDNIARSSEQNYSVTRPISLLQTVQMLVNDGGNLILPGINILGDPDEGNQKKQLEEVNIPVKIEITPFAVFKKDQLVGWLDNQTSKGFNSVLGEVKGSMTNVLCDEKEYNTFQTTGTKSKIDVRFEQNKPIITVKHEVSGMLCKVGCNIDLTNPQNISKLEKSFEVVLTKQLEESVKTIQTEFQSDIFGFGSIVHRKNHKLWKELSENWDEEFTKLQVEIKVDVKIEKPGDIVNPIIKDVK